MTLALNLKKWGYYLMFKKIFLTLSLFLLFQLNAFANGMSSSINEILNSFDFDRDSVVSISVRDKETGLTVYEKQAYKALNPASTLKLFTIAADIDTLGADYNFDTAFYKDGKNNLYLKLSGDPLFTNDDMKQLSKKLKESYKGKINKIYIDDSIMDKVSYPDGWTVDDYWPNSPKISPYMVDRNTVKVDFYIEPNGAIRIVQKDAYRFAFINKLKKGETTSVKLVQDDTHNTIDVEGTIKENLVGMEVPVLNPKYFFCNKLHKALANAGIMTHEKFLFGKVPNNAVLVTKFSRPLKEIAKQTLLVSDNLSSEMLFKVAGQKYAQKKNKQVDSAESLGTTENGIEMFFDYYNKLGIDTKNIKLRDGSGVSRYNVMNTAWMTSAISKINMNYEDILPTADEGTLSKRMREMKNEVYFKTGTLYGLSSLAGIIKSGNKEYSYASVIMGYNRTPSLIKGVEDEIVYEIYRANKEK